ncbi:hypothetical protein GCK72_022929 [Caenorhabditis remanei]|uniref:Uncharacterized protein n=1 Tax=Caenorhabditis remanei TaxID=31234 RepID=A0A6A5FVA5_CAERE|nr:hypothetical protein GCK72_022929 [Caenorhabditis remanei]KAF1746473.1 hypothetical protein GCK72_022929 [Caenorhabditis remanei]
MEAEVNAIQHDANTMEETIHFLSKNTNFQDEIIKMKDDKLKCCQYELAAQKKKENQLIDEKLQLSHSMDISASQNTALREELLVLGQNDITNRKTARDLHKLMSETLRTLNVSCNGINVFNQM